jgi:heat shock protein HslJ
VPRPTRANHLAAGLALLFLLSMAGCAASSISLDGREFLSTAVTEGGAPLALVPGTRIRLVFHDGTVSAQAGCNSIGGPYHLDGGLLVVGDLAMTEMGCDVARNAQDEWLTVFLRSKPGATLSGPELALDNGRASIRLLDRTVAEPDLALVGPAWTVTSIIDGGAVSSVPAGATASFAFHGDGSVDVIAGCNRGRGSWSLAGAVLSIRDVALTKMACDGPAGALETAVVAVLDQGTLQASIKASALTLQAGTKGLQLTGS